MDQLLYDLCTFLCNWIAKGSGGERGAAERQRSRPHRADDYTVRQRGDGQRKRAGRHVRVLRARSPAHRDRVPGAWGRLQVGGLRGDNAALVHPLRRHGPLRAPQLCVSDRLMRFTFIFWYIEFGIGSQIDSSLVFIQGETRRESQASIPWCMLTWSMIL